MFALLQRYALIRPWLIIIPILAAVAATGVLIIGLLYWSAFKIDLASAKQEQQIVSAAIDRSALRVAKDQEASTVWDDAVTHTRARDADWLDSNLGIWMNTYYGHDETFVLNPDDVPIYAMIDGERVAPDRFAEINEAATPIVRELRRKLRSGDKPEAPDMLSTGALDIAVVGGHPAIISAKPIVSDTGNIPQEPGAEAIHISVRYLDGSFVTRLATNYFLKDARFSWQDARGAGQVALPYRARDGRPFGYLVWSPYLPGSDIRGSMQVALGAALVGVALIIGVLTFALRLSEAHVRHLAGHDPLTGLPNRMFFNERLQKLFSDARSGTQKLALLSLDLDRFKQVNDDFGHPAGDELLRQVGARFSECIRGSDVVARIGGDEFSVILPTASDGLIENVCSRLLAAAREPFDVLGHPVSIGLSIGIAVAPTDAQSKDDLIRRSDLALYAAKQRGRNQYVRFSQALERRHNAKPRALAPIGESAAVGAL